ncbi:MAG: UDP-N-acetylmuramate--L-alanine ligase [Bacteroidales bacterium]|jgi:UDP-N-acetylmuramate--alanine ligase|nr:UDP-N-acetylmuramate--L-alanine ligase [Bacteroidales bacterium]
MNKNIYFIGIGGIGMSALARYFAHKGYNIFGYDRTKTDLTEQLSSEGIKITYEDDINILPQELDLAIYTPAIHFEDSHILTELHRRNTPIYKRSQILGLISEDKKTLAVAGTHGKTTISGMIAHILFQSPISCTALLGGISKNYDTNLLFNHNEKSKYLVVEADEYDRSFLTLHPFNSVISAVDADHLDIYNTKENLLSAFQQFASQTNMKEGTLFVNEKIANLFEGNIETYSLNNIETDYYAWNIRVYKGNYYFDFHTPNKVYFDMCLSYPGLHNIENAIVAMGVCLKCGIDEESLRKGLQSFNGMKRRFDVRVKNNNTIYIDDYAHHPAEIETCIKSIRHLYPDKRITGIFQPHLYSRTRDLKDEFITSLELLDEIILLDIYPAREQPIEGITSHILFSNIKKMNKYYVTKDQLLELIPALKPQILLTIGAGDIDKLVKPIEDILQQ